MIGVDVILITYNQEQYIRQALDGLLKQRINPDVSVHVIVADDCSADNTLSIIQSMAEKSLFEYTYLPSDTNVGMHKNYERAFKACKSDYVAILEGDDYWTSPSHLMNHVTFLHNHPECSMTMNNIMLYEEKTGAMRLHRSLETEYTYVDLQMQIAQGNQLGNLSACMFRREYINTIPQKMYEMGFADWLLGMWMAKYGMIVILKEITSLYRLNANGQWTRMNDAERKNRLLKLINDYDEFFEHRYHSYFEEYRRQIFPPQKNESNLRKYMPPIIKDVVKLLLPPVIYKWIKK